MNAYGKKIVDLSKKIFENTLIYTYTYCNYLCEYVMINSQSTH